MDFKLIISDTALAELGDAVVFIAENSYERAKKYENDVLDKLEKLEKDPYLGKPHPIDKLKKLGYRKLTVESHTAHYLVDKDKKQIHVIRLLHSAMDEKKRLKDM